jgi:hypothetical protein
MSDYLTVSLHPNTAVGNEKELSTGLSLPHQYNVRVKTHLVRVPRDLTEMMLIEFPKERNLSQELYLV